jgi:hypothetical protein
MLPQEQQGTGCHRHSRSKTERRFHEIEIGILRHCPLFASNSPPICSPTANPHHTLGTTNVQPPVPLLTPPQQIQSVGEAHGEISGASADLSVIGNGAASKDGELQSEGEGVHKMNRKEFP